MSSFVRAATSSLRSGDHDEGKLQAMVGIWPLLLYAPPHAAGAHALLHVYLLCSSPALY
jgi:hypothetical protein